MFVYKMTVDKMTIDKRTVGEMTVYKMTVDWITVYEIDKRTKDTIAEKNVQTKWLLMK